MSGYVECYEGKLSRVRGLEKEDEIYSFVERSPGNTSVMSRPQDEVRQ